MESETDWRDIGVWSLPEGGRGDAPDHFLRSGLLRLLSSQSPRLAHGSLSVEARR